MSEHMIDRVVIHFFLLLWELHFLLPHFLEEYPVFWMRLRHANDLLSNIYMASINLNLFTEILSDSFLIRLRSNDVKGNSFYMKNYFFWYYELNKKVFVQRSQHPVFYVLIQNDIYQQTIRMNIIWVNIYRNFKKEY